MTWAGPRRFVEKPGMRRQPPPEEAIELAAPVRFRELGLPLCRFPGQTVEQVRARVLEDLARQAWRAPTF